MVNYLAGESPRRLCFCTCCLVSEDNHEKETQGLVKYLFGKSEPLSQMKTGLSHLSTGNAELPLLQESNLELYIKNKDLSFPLWLSMLYSVPVPNSNILLSQED
jgi:hypothetical protein